MGAVNLLMLFANVSAVIIMIAIYYAYKLAVYNELDKEEVCNN